jgi:glycosyltransferase involved in cell wall biosynthesis
MPTVSVVIPCYNAGDYLPEAITSVSAQTCKAFEIIVVDDGSDDPATLQHLQQLENTAEVRLLRSAVNRGVAAARNLGIQAARGSYILPLDADDLIMPDYLEKALAIFTERPETAIVTCDAWLFGESSGVRQLPDYTPERLLRENLLFSSSLFRKADWLAVGGYCTAMRYGWEDWEFWISLTRLRSQVVKINEPLLQYRIRRDSRDRSMGTGQKLTMLLLIIGRHLISYLTNPASLVALGRNLLAHTVGIQYAP